MRKPTVYGLNHLPKPRGRRQQVSRYVQLAVAAFAAAIRPISTGQLHLPNWRSQVPHIGLQLDHFSDTSISIPLLVTVTSWSFGHV
ncbi:MAG: hypothetical protein ABGX22_21140 [Pirellulaceae bacterium]|nr:hypothetical protein [Planctomycetaceae bacterium]